jgi:hypothetical protein
MSTIRAARLDYATESRQTLLQYSSISSPFHNFRRSRHIPVRSHDILQPNSELSAMETPASAAPHGPTIPVRQNSFFTHLNYDVRYMMYEYLDPAIISSEAAGLILSCREAKTEFDSVSMRKVNNMCKQMEDTVEQWIGYKGYIPRLLEGPAFNAADQITIELPVLLLHRRREWMRWIFFRHLIYPLIALRFQDITFEFRTPQITETPVTQETEEGKDDDEEEEEVPVSAENQDSLIREFMVHTETGIQCATKLGYVTELAGEGNGVHGFPLLRAQARCVVLSWELPANTVTDIHEEHVSGLMTSEKIVKNVNAGGNLMWVDEPDELDEEQEGGER